MTPYRSRDYKDITRMAQRAFARGAGVEGSINKAVRDSVKKTIFGLKSELKSGLAVGELSRFTGIAPRVIKKYQRVGIYAKNRSIRVWYGLNDIPLKNLNPVQNGSIVNAGPAKVAGGFIIKAIGGGQVFKRVGSKRSMRSGSYKGKMRQPLKKQKYSIRQEGEQSARSLMDIMKRKLERILTIDIETNLRTKGLI